MGPVLTRQTKDVVKADFKVEFFKWSSAQFPEEYALIYNYDDEFRTCTFRLSASHSKVRCEVLDHTCEDHPVRFEVEFIAERDDNNNDGDLKIGEIKFDRDGNIGAHNFSPEVGSYWYLYSCEIRGITEFSVNYKPNSHDNSIWVITHNIESGFKTSFSCQVYIRCDKRKGFCVELCGPYKKTGLILPKVASLLIHRKVVGEPPKPKASNAIVKGRALKEEEEEEGYNVSQVGSVSLTKGAIHNSGGQTQGNYNGSIFNNCRFH